VVYGGGQDPLSFEVDSRDLRLALAHAGALLDLAVDGESPSPVVLKELIRHPVTGETTHIDLLRVRLDQAIQSTVVVEILGAEDSPGVKEGGVLEQVTREIVIEALPTDIPDGMQYDVSALQINDTINVEALEAPEGVTIVTEPETVLVMLSPPRLVVDEEPEIEEETGLVAEGETGEQADEQAEESSGESGGEGEG
jgi:large subunit ribosomal protein L25